MGQNKKKKICIIIDIKIDLKNKKLFLNLFRNINYILIILTNKEYFSEEIRKCNSKIIVFLGIEDYMLDDIDNDTRLFSFYTSDNKNYKIAIKETHVVIDFNSFFYGFILSSCYIKYEVLSDKLYIDISEVHGFGVFANINIDKQETLFNLSGQIVNKEIIDKLNFYGEWNAIKHNKFLVRKNRTTYGFINHSKTPNCYLDQNLMCLISLKKIYKGEEILLDYRKEPLPID